MYAQSSNKRKYTTTPIVRMNKDNKEEIVCLITLPKMDGEILAERIIFLLNDDQDMIDIVNS